MHSTVRQMVAGDWDPIKDLYLEMKIAALDLDKGYSTHPDPEVRRSYTFRMADCVRYLTTIERELDALERGESPDKSELSIAMGFLCGELKGLEYSWEYMQRTKIDD